MFRSRLVVPLVATIYGCVSLRAQTDPYEAALRSARIALHAHDYDAAIEPLRRAVELRPAARETAQSLAAALSHVGANASAAGDTARARDCYAEAVRHWPRQPPLLACLGELELQMGAHDDAKAAFRSVVSMEPDNVRALAGLGRVAVAQDDVAAAAEFFARAHRAAPDRLDLAALASRHGKHAEVESKFVTLRHGIFELEYEPGRAVGVERVLPALRRWLSAAQRDLRRDLGRVPKDPVAIVLYAKGQFQRVTSARHWAKAYYDGKVRFDLGDYDERGEELAATLRHELAHAFLDRLYPDLPPWLHEGYAQVTDGRSVATSRALLRGAPLLAGSAFVEGFANSDDVARVRRGYAQAHVVVDRLRRAGRARNFTALLRAVSSGTASALAVREIYALDLDAAAAPAARPGR